MQENMKRRGKKVKERKKEKEKEKKEKKDTTKVVGEEGGREEGKMKKKEKKQRCSPGFDVQEWCKHTSASQPSSGPKSGLYCHHSQMLECACNNEQSHYEKY